MISPFFNSRRRFPPSCRRGSGRPRRRRGDRTGGFTLVELLTVAGIIALLLAAVVPAIRGPLGSNARRGAVTNLLGALDQARALAISEGRATYVVFVSPRPNLTGATNPATPEPRKCGTAYAIFQEKDMVNFENAQRSAWLSFPVGVAFKVNDADGQPATLLNRPLSPDKDPQFLVPAGTPGGQTFPPQPLYQPYVRFDATGAADVPPALARVLIFEGSVGVDGQELPTKRIAGGGGPDAQRFIWEEVRFNPATGRARYTTDPGDILVAAATPTPAP